MKHMREGLWQGDSGDLKALLSREVRDKLRFTLIVNVGHSPYLPLDVQTVYFPMQDSDAWKDNDWDRAVYYVRLVYDEIRRRQGKVLVVCDAGLSRSVVFCGMVMSLLTRNRMSEPKLKQKLMNPFVMEGLWQNAAEAMEFV